MNSNPLNNSESMNLSFQFRCKKVVMENGERIHFLNGPVY